MFTWQTMAARQWTLRGLQSPELTVSELIYGNLIVILFGNTDIKAQYHTFVPEGFTNCIHTVQYRLWTHKSDKAPQKATNEQRNL